MVGEGFGISLILSSTSGGAHKEVVFVPISDGLEDIRFSAVWSPKNHNPALKHFLDLATGKRDGMQLSIRPIALGERCRVLRYFSTIRQSLVFETVRQKHPEQRAFPLRSRDRSQ